MATNQAFLRLRVNARRLLRVLPFTVVAVAILAALPSSARADRVLVLHPVGDGTPEQRHAVEAAFRTALQGLSYDVVLESEQLGVEDDAALPEDANDFRAVADLTRCVFALAPALAFEEGGYHLTLRVGYAPATRLETLTTEVRSVRENDRLTEILRAVLRPEGMGDAQQQFAGPDTAAQALEAAQAEERARTQADEDARRAAAEADAARTAEEERQRQALADRERQLHDEEARNARANRERYGVPQRMMMLGGLGLVGILNATPGARGGAVAELEGRFGYSIPSIPGFELRGGLDINVGRTGGFALTGGAVYLASPFTTAKVHIGGGLELGFYQALSGNRVPQLWTRAEAIVSWHVTNKLWLEAALPTLTILSANGGILTLGTAVRIGTRF